MKKLLKKSLILLLLLVMIPLSSFLVACGASPGKDAKAVLFVSDKYDEVTGQAIFEVDLNVATTLTFKCNPSTSTNTVRYTIPVEGQTNSSLNRSRFTFEKGVITVDNEDFEQIEIKVTVNGQTWRAIGVSNDEFFTGEKVQVEGITGTKVIVSKINNEKIIKL